MADNDRIKIIKETMPSVESNGVTIILHNKMISEYEDIIAETLLNQKIVKSGRGLNNHTIGELYDIRKECQQLAKAVCNRLFGEGE